MAFTNSNNNSDKKFERTVSTPATASTLNKDTKGTLSGTASLYKSPSLQTTKPATSSILNKGSSTAAAFSKTQALTSVSSATAARPSALSSLKATTSAAKTSSTFSSSSRPSSALGARPATTTATRTTSLSSAGGSTSSFASRTSITTPATARATSSTMSTSTSASTVTRSASSTSSVVSATRPSSVAAKTSVAPRTSLSSSSTARTSSVAPRASTLTSSTRATTTRLNPVSNADFAKKIAQTTAALASARARPVSTDASGNASLVKENQEVTDVQYRRFASFIEDKCGIVLGSGKQYLVNSRLSSLLPKFGVATVDELINRAMEETPNNKIQEEVVDAMTTNETLWFRDTYPYTALETLILPDLAKKAKYPVRIWSAACSSGQEPYSIGIIVQEQMGKMLHIDPKQTQIIGTDLSPEMLSVCRHGQYDVHALSRGLSAERKSKYFKPCHHKANMMQIDHRVKSLVEFRPMNLLGSYALMGKFDVIFCRNVLIYFSNDVKAEILRKLTMCLNPGGYLILGSTETLVGVADKFEMVRCNPGIIYRLKPQKYAFNN